MEKLKGLLQKAETVLVPQSQPPAQAEDSIISNEEQTDILKEIDRITGQSRISVTPDLFKISALKNGVLFPLLVNLVAIAILGGGIFATKFYFDIKDKEMVQASVEQQSAEGNLIKEIKKETEEKLAAKENEIQDIQANMNRIESERQALEQDMTSKINERQTQLEEEMEAALAAEREKLQAQGVSTDKIDEQIAALKLEQNSIFEEELQSYREEAELEKIELESNLNQLQNEYNSKLVSINEERAKIEAEAQTREAELTERMEARTRELETEKTAAQQELQKLTESQEQESLVENQIIGFYKSIEDEIKDGDLDNASVELKNLENYLYDESVTSLTGISKRREIDLFVIDSLSKLIESSRINPQEELDTMSLIDAAERLKEIQQIVQNADQQLAVGNNEMADLMYRSALEKIPEINKSHRFFLDSMESELELGYEQLSDIQGRFDQLQQLNSDREAGVSSFLTDADRNYQSGDYSAAVDSYRNAFEATGYDNMDRAADRMIESGNTIAIAPFKEKLSDMTEEVESLQSYKDSSLNELQTLEFDLAQKEEELNTINEKYINTDSDVDSLSEKVQSSEVELASINDKLESEKNQVVLLKDQLEQQTEEISTYEQRIEELKLDLESEQRKASTSNEDSLIIDKEIAELTTLKAQLNRLNKSYTDFELMADNLEDNIKGDAETIEAMYDFFEEDAVEDVMPGISDYLRSFSNVYITAGTEIGLYESVSLFYDLNSLNTNREKRQLLRARKDDYQDNEAMVELINQIEKTMGQDE